MAITDPWLEHRKAIANGADLTEAQRVRRIAEFTRQEEIREAEKAAGALARLERQQSDAAKAQRERDDKARALQADAVELQREHNRLARAELAIAEAEAAEEAAHRARLEQAAKEQARQLAKDADRNESHREAMLDSEKERLELARDAASPLYAMAKRVAAFRVREIASAQRDALRHFLSSQVGADGSYVGPFREAVDLMNASDVLREEPAIVARGLKDLPSAGTWPSAFDEASLITLERLRAQPLSELQEQRLAERLEERDQFMSDIRGLLADKKHNEQRRDGAVRDAMQIIADRDADLPQRLAPLIDELEAVAREGRALLDQCSLPDYWGAAHVDDGWRSRCDEQAGRDVDFARCQLLEALVRAPGFDAEAGIVLEGVGSIPVSARQIQRFLEAFASNAHEYHLEAIRDVLMFTRRIDHLVNNLQSDFPRLDKFGSDSPLLHAAATVALDLGMHLEASTLLEEQVHALTLIRGYAIEGVDVLSFRRHVNALWAALRRVGCIHRDRHLPYPIDEATPDVLGIDAVLTYLFRDDPHAEDAVVVDERNAPEVLKLVTYWLPPGTQKGHFKKGEWVANVPPEFDLGCYAGHVALAATNVPAMLDECRAGTVCYPDAEGFFLATNEIELSAEFNPLPTDAELRAADRAEAAAARKERNAGKSWLGRLLG